MRFRQKMFSLLTLLLSLLPAGTAMAHDYSVAYTSLNIDSQETTMEYALDTLSVIEGMGGDANSDGQLDESELNAMQARVEEWFDDSLALEVGQQQLAGELLDMKLEQRVDKNLVTAHFKFPGIEPGQLVSLTDGILASGAQNANYANFMLIHAGNSDSQAVLQGKTRTWSMLVADAGQDAQGAQGQATEPEPNKSGNGWLYPVVIGIVLAAALAVLIGVRQRKRKK